ncbi:lysosome-associated membrane glycoprotein 3-like isoform X2 [Scyliorhinus canicula]|uniref:lysosome-associated membrane glycoprotein 3-like isoform X2 n=1 Tax=Scyliorhinus canicula TaxID=7830 RepID=UPI0018F5F05A|nr:lysosome-associated membrane glycoprotein 3-like isoform X2 [Scyliorhinus canicula]
MSILVLLASAFVFCGFHLSSAVLTEGAASSDVPNLVAVSAKPTTTTPHPTTTTTPHPTTTTTPHPTTTAHVTNTTKHVTTAHVTNATTVHVTNTTTAQNTTTAHATTTVLPTLTPHFSLPNTGQYNVSLKNVTCIKVTIGVQLSVKQKAKDLYFNIPPDETRVSGKCGDGASWIIFKFNSGFVNFTFVKDGKQYYVSEMSVALNAMNNLGTSYRGTVNHMKLFRTTLGYSYKCNSEQIVSFSTDSLHILIVNTQLQAFGVPGGKFGPVQKCALDSKFIVPILFGISVFILIVAVIVVYLICRRRRFVGYQRI